MAVTKGAKSIFSCLFKPVNMCHPNLQNPAVLASRSFSNSADKKVIVVTGASRGVGYAVSKNLATKFPHSYIYCTTRSGADQLTYFIREELGSSSSDRVTFKQMDVVDLSSVVRFRNQIFDTHGEIDALINNAGMYFYPTDNPTEHFVQVQRTLDTNYWGLKNVVNAFIPKLSDTARIVNMSSNYSMLRMIPGREIRNILGKPDLSEKDLDELMMEYQRRSTEFNDDFAELGFPRCAYTVSKVAVNAYTRILQRGFEQRGKPGVVVRSIHPGSYHSKITQEGDLFTTATEAAEAVVSAALLPQDGNRGQFIWHDGNAVAWDEDNKAGGRDVAEMQ